MSRIWLDHSKNLFPRLFLIRSPKLSQFYRHPWHHLLSISCSFSTLTPFFQNRALLKGVKLFTNIFTTSSWKNNIDITNSRSNPAKLFPFDINFSFIFIDGTSRRFFPSFIDNILSSMFMFKNKQTRHYNRKQN